MTPAKPRSLAHGETWAALLSSACFVHCVGLAALAPFLPAVGIVAHNRNLEWALFAASAGLGLWFGIRSRALLPRWFLAAPLAAAGMGAYGHLIEAPRLEQAGLIALAGLQLFVLRRRMRAHAHHAHRPAHSHCCETTLPT